MAKDTHTCFACGERGHKAVNCAENSKILHCFSRPLPQRRRGPAQGRNNATLAKHLVENIDGMDIQLDSKAHVDMDFPGSSLLLLLPPPQTLTQMGILQLTSIPDQLRGIWGCLVYLKECR